MTQAMECIFIWDEDIFEHGPMGASREEVCLSGPRQSRMGEVYSGDPAKGVRLINEKGRQTLNDINLTNTIGGKKEGITADRSVVCF